MADPSQRGIGPEQSTAALWTLDDLSGTEAR